MKLKLIIGHTYKVHIPAIENEWCSLSSEDRILRIDEYPEYRQRITDPDEYFSYNVERGVHRWFTLKDEHIVEDITDA